MTSLSRGKSFGIISSISVGRASDQAHNGKRCHLVAKIPSGPSCISRYRHAGPRRCRGFKLVGIRTIRRVHDGLRSVRDNGLELGALDYLLKPFAADRFERVFRRAQTVLQSRNRAGELGLRIATGPGQAFWDLSLEGERILPLWLAGIKGREEATITR